MYQNSQFSGFSPYGQRGIGIGEAPAWQMPSQPAALPADNPFSGNLPVRRPSFTNNTQRARRPVMPNMSRLNAAASYQQPNYHFRADGTAATRDPGLQAKAGGGWQVAADQAPQSVPMNAMTTMLTGNYARPMAPQQHQASPWLNGGQAYPTNEMDFQYRQRY